MLQVKKFSGTYKEILPLADVYMRSYNQLSKAYKSRAEMALYTKVSFIKKLETWAINQADGKEPFIYVLYNNDKPCGVMRLNHIPDDYRKINDNYQAVEKERGYLDGWQIARNRRIDYSTRFNYTDNTLILNQIYLAPEEQNKGFGTYFIKQVFTELHKRGYNQFIVEYNDNNINGKKFHEGVLCARKIAHTTDFDHITTSKRGKTNFCLSPVSIGISNFSEVLDNIAVIERYFANKAKGL